MWKRGLKSVKRECFRLSFLGNMRKREREKGNIFIGIGDVMNCKGGLRTRPFWSFEIIQLS